MRRNLPLWTTFMVIAFLPSTSISMAAAGDPPAKPQGRCGNELRGVAVPEGLLVRLYLQKLNDSVMFKESLSLGEYPDLRVENENGRLSISIGMSLFQDRDEDNIRVIAKAFDAETQAYEIVQLDERDEPVNGGWHLWLQVDRRTKTALLKDLTPGENAFVVAEFGPTEPPAESEPGT